MGGADPGRLGPLAGRPGLAAVKELLGPSLHCAALICLRPSSGQAGPRPVLPGCPRGPALPAPAGRHRSQRGEPPRREGKGRAGQGRARPGPAPKLSEHHFQPGESQTLALAFHSSAGVCSSSEAVCALRCSLSWDEIE